MKAKTKPFKLLQGNCLELMKDIPDASIDLILCDLPYGITKCKWDTIIPFEPLWEQYKRIAKPNTAIVLTASGKFTHLLAMSNLHMLKYDLVWDKVNLYTGTLQANKQPLRRHETVLVFYTKQPLYNKQYREGRPYTMTRNGVGVGSHVSDVIIKRKTTINNGQHNPCSILEIKSNIKKEKGLHSTQKPVDLMEYLIKTYTNPGDMVLDNCMGSGTTGVAALNLKRKFIGMELDETYFLAAKERIETVYNG